MTIRQNERLFEATTLIMLRLSIQTARFDKLQLSGKGPQA